MIRQKQLWSRFVAALLITFFLVVGPIGTVFLLEPTEANAEETTQLVQGSPGAGVFAANEHTVKFMVAGSTEPYYTAHVLDGMLVDLPSAPPSSSSVPFHAWFLEGGTTLFDYTKPVKADLTLVAVFSTNHLVTYLDYDSDPEITSYLGLASVTHGATLPAPAKPPKIPQSLQFEYWSLVGTDTPFNGPVDSDITVYPVVSKNAVAVFVTDGPVIASQVGPGDGTFFPSKPADNSMEKAGYLFDHWSSVEGGTNSFNFTQPLPEGTTYIYAVWNPAKVGYTINFWNEKAGIVGDPGDDPNNYELVYSRPILSNDPLAGMTESTLNLTSTADGPEDTITKAIIEERDNYSAGTTLLDYSDFAWTDAHEKPLSGTGDTVINVYAKRSVFTYTFDLTNPRPLSFKLTGNDSVFTSTDFLDGKYSFEAKLGTDVTHLWPRNITPLNESDKNEKFHVWNGYWGSSSIVVDRGSIQKLMTNDFRSTERPQNANGGQPHLLQASWLTTGAYELRYYYTEVFESTLSDDDKARAIPSRANDGSHGEAPTKDVLVVHTAEGITRYYEFHSHALDYHIQHVFSEHTARGWPGEAIFGFKTITTDLTEKYQVVGLNVYKHNELDGSYLCYYMPRAEYHLTLLTGASATIENADADGYTLENGDYKRSFAYEEDVSIPDTPPVKTDGSAEFVGWYLDEKFTQPFYVDGLPALGTMPGHDVTLYAKYKGVGVEVQYYDDVDGERIAISEYGKNDLLSKSDLVGTAFETLKVGDMVAGKGIFNGWLYDVDGQGNIANIAFGTILTEPYYALYADFIPQPYTVTFMTPDATGAYAFHKQIMTKSGSQSALSWRGYTERMINDVSRDGYTFVGWNTQEDGTGAAFNTSSGVPGDITVYAQFVRNSDGPGDTPSNPQSLPGSGAKPSTGDSVGLFGVLVVLSASLLALLVAAFVRRRFE